MPSIRIDPDQRFTCAGCARCCTRWQVIVSPAEAARYRQQNAARWFSEPGDPFVPLAAAQGFFTIRQRGDGACGFLSPANRCRIHEQLGGAAKPLTCRMFPFSVHPSGEADVVRASFSCPTVVANAGAAVGEGDIKPLRTEWFRTYPRQPREPVLLEGRRIDQPTLKILRAGLIDMLNRRGVGGHLDLTANLRRITATLDDLSRPKVVRLEDARFAEYVTLTVRFAAKSEPPIGERTPSLMARVRRRGFLFVTKAIQVRGRARRIRLLLHVHGLGPAVGDFDVRLARRVNVDVNSPDVQPIAHHYLRSSIQTLGSGKRPVINELLLAMSSLHAARTLSAIAAARAGAPIDAAIFSRALAEAADVTHADTGLMSRALDFLSS